MNRELKFRGKAFVPNARVLLSWEYAAYDDDHWVQFWQHVDQATLGQYTGLKDRLGKEIYEGDIVRCYDGVLDSHFNTVVKWQTADVQDDSSPMPLIVSGFIIGSLSDVEVIGNIHDNPDLSEASHEKCLGLVSPIVQFDTIIGYTCDECGASCGPEEEFVHGEVKHD